MATSTELLRAAEHMRAAFRETGCMLKHAAAGELEREAMHLQAIEAQQPKRSWPEGWPPFSVLRRAYEMLDIMPLPSIRCMERHGDKSERSYAKRVREDFAQAVAEEM